MDVFATKDMRAKKLTVENYLTETRKSYPYFQKDKNGKMHYYALCPACGNPIQIINLFGKQYKEQVTGKRTMHGRHCRKNIKGIANYNKRKYDSCYLHKANPFGINEIREEQEINEEILNIIQNNEEKICKDIREITGIFWKNEWLKDQIIKPYIDSKNYCYMHTNKYNIPYSILYTSKALDIWGRKVKSNKLGRMIEDAVNNKSNWFEMKGHQISSTVIGGYTKIKMIVFNHIYSSDNTNTQYMTIQITEEFREETNIVFKKDIRLENYIYD